ncbi:lysine-specific histone demethylase 1 homolog 3 [Andrographis paniculata]|uniref:lysine-specific histone demethylase 1 homolog 3 n=1 Tax=Andrographis paniculata TaxID=175694 RepID=UPI0021E97D3D|nr:lysine-specific histone demethylase 1 homolog 3 [Andrographis paniculata]
MDKEENKVSLKRKLKSVEIAVDTDDDEPIGALLKLKGKRISKKSKVVTDASGKKGNEAEKLPTGDDELVCMDDTLANFRKKLRGPKAVVAGKDFSNSGALSCQSVNDSAKDSRLDVILASEAPKRSIGSGDSVSHGDETISEGLKAKSKNKRSEISSDGLDYSKPENHEEGGVLDSEAEGLEDSLYDFFQKVQSGKSLKSRRLRQGKEVQTSGGELKPKTNSDAGLEVPDKNSPSASDPSKNFMVPDDQGTVKSPGNSIDQKPEHSYGLLDSILPLGSVNGLNYDSVSLVDNPSSSLRACSNKIPDVEDGKINSNSTNELLNSEDILCRNAQQMVANDLVASMSFSGDLGTNRDDTKQENRGDDDKGQEGSVLLQLHSPPLTVNPPPEELLSADRDGPIVVVGNCCKETIPAPLSSQGADDDVSECRSSPISTNEDNKYIVAFRKREDKSQKGVDEPGHDLETSHTLPASGFPTNNSDDPSEDEAINGTSLASATLDNQGSSGEDRSPLDLETKENNLSVGQRAVRNAKRHRHEDMAYDDEVDWEVLMQSQELFPSVHKTREKQDSLPTTQEADPIKVAAVAAGLKGRAGPLEKVKFKEVLKRKGGQQEYLECRNRILRAWNKDFGRLLRLEDFNVSDSPLDGESPCDSLTRDVFKFLDQHGHINFGVPSEKKAGSRIKDELKLSTEDKLGENPEVGVSIVLSNEKKPDTLTQGKNDSVFANEKLMGKSNPEDGLLESSGPSAEGIPEGCPPGDSEGINSLEHMTPEEAKNSKSLDSIPSCKDMYDKKVSPANPDLPISAEEVCGVPMKHFEDGSDILSTSNNCDGNDMHSDSGSKKNVIIVGAGPAGLTAARHLQRQGFSVTVLEARSRIGGRVFTDRSSLSVPVDLGASIITGVEADVESERRPDPSSLICAQLGLELTVLNSECPLYDIVTGEKVPPALDAEVEAEFNSLINDMDQFADEKGHQAMQMSLEEGLEYNLQTRSRVCPPPENNEVEHVAEDLEAPVGQAESLNPLERRIMDWHWAHLEYGCAAPLNEISLPNWNQDDVYGGFGGPHCMIKGGYSAVVESLAQGVCIRLNHIVTEISYSTPDDVKNNLHKRVKVCTSNGKEFWGDAALVTVPLGCLKAEAIKFSPKLPQWKELSVKRLGFGVLNKIILEFPEVFWDNNVDYFGATAEVRDQRGRCFMFWNVKKTVGAPVLIALLVGKAALDGQRMNPSDHVSHALLVLRVLFGEDKVPDPVASVVTNWGTDPYSYGAYSYVAVGSSGEDYDLLGQPVDNCLFFAGEATCKEHPDTVGGAMISGLREAVRIIDILSTGTDYTAEVEGIEAARRHSDIGRTEVKDIVARLDAAEYTSALLKKSLDGAQVSAWVSMLKEMFYSTKTRSGRLRLAKELLNIPVRYLKSFASTKQGLRTLNSWILDSMGKNGTQLLRHCVRLLVLVSNDLLAVRSSGIGKTVKEKVCVHTSRDIRAIASQLVSVWVELFRKEKSSKTLKLLRHQTGLDSKSKFSQHSGKPPIRTHSSDVKASIKKAVDELGRSKTKVHIKSDVQPSNSHGSAQSKKEQEEDHEIPMSEEEKAAFAAAEAARAAAEAAAKALASGAMQNASLQPPKILSFHKFAMREQHTPMDESEIRKQWTGAAAIGKQDCLSEIDSRNCRVRDWSVDFTATGVHLESSKMSADNHSQRSHSNEMANQLNIKEHSAENVAVDSCILTRAWVDNAGSIGIKDYNAIERWQCQAAAASSGFSHGTMPLTDEEDSNMSSKLSKQKRDALANESSASHVSIHRELKGKPNRGPDRIKQSVVDYVATLLMPLFKSRKIDRDGYKYIMKKTATKVMEQASDVEKSMTVDNFLDYKRKNKIRAFVDMLIERHMATKPDVRSGSSDKD